MQLSNRINTLKVSPIRNLAPYEKAATKKGLNVIKMNIGQPDIKTPKEFFSAINKSDIDVLSYSPSEGREDLLSSLEEYYTKIGYNFTKDDMMITQGGSEGINFVFTTLLDEGEKVLMPEPFYANYENIAHLANVNFTPIKRKTEDNFALPAYEEILPLVDEKTKAIMFTNPCNPSGRVYTKEEVETIVRIAKEKDLFIISDEVYREFIYDGREYVSVTNYKEVEDKIVIIDSISKRYSCCGSRIGNIASKNKEIMDKMVKLAQVRLSASTLDQIGAANLKTVPENYFAEILDDYNSRRDTLVKELSQIDGIVFNKPEGAFYTIIDLPVKDAQEFAIWTLQNINIDGNTLLMTPGSGFYQNPQEGKNKIRLSYCLNEEQIKLGIRILKKALEEFNK